MVCLYLTHILLFIVWWKVKVCNNHNLQYWVCPSWCIGHACIFDMAFESVLRVVHNVVEMLYTVWVNHNSMVEITRACIHTHKCAHTKHTQTFMHTYMRTHKQVFTHICTLTCAHTNTHIHVHVHTKTGVHAYKHTNTCTHTHTNMHAHSCTHMLTNMCAHTNAYIMILQYVFI